MKISAADFKAKCLSLMDRVQEFHEEVIITKHGKPVAKLVPVEKTRPRSVFGLMKGTVEIRGDIISHIDMKWDAETE